MANALKDQKSPYLKQHACDPVQWYPWSEKAFNMARTLNKAIFLSIGYSTCHWCHVMQKESFQDQEIADLLNRHFICIKVDREERPDIDQIYMNFCQALTGRGGWPLNVFLTPDGTPFYAFTYMPARERFGLPGMKKLLSTVAMLWAEKSEEVVKEAQRISTILQKYNERARGDIPPQRLIDKGFWALKTIYDPEHGGFGVSPKFPVPHNILFLLRYHWYSTQKDALKMAEHTLMNIFKGGIHDHVGGGFHRYSTDEMWRLPHFEKMLYDQALMLYAFAEAFLSTSKMLYREMVEETAEFILNEMLTEDGGFITAIDADSDSVEGGYYLWQKREIIDILGAEKGELFCELFGVTGEGNVVTAEEQKGMNVLFMKEAPEEFASRKGMDPLELRRTVEFCLRRLRCYRLQRPHPFKDEKILLDQNSLVAAAFAHAYRATGRWYYLIVALRLLGFLLHRLADEQRLYHGLIDGVPTEGVYLDDYAFLLWALLEVYECTFDPVILKKAVTVAREMLTLFRSKQGCLYFTVSHENLPVRPIEGMDGAIPSGNSVAVWGLLKLYSLTAEEQFRVAAEDILRCFSRAIEDTPEAHGFMLNSLLYYHSVQPVLVIVAENFYQAQQSLSKLRSHYWPFLSVHLKHKDNALLLEKVAPLTAQYRSDRKVTFYLCADRMCFSPVESIEEVFDILDRLKKTGTD